MTVLAVVFGGVDVVAMASDSSTTTRDLATGAVLRRGEPRGGIRSKLYSLSTRHSLAAGTFGLSGSKGMGSGMSVRAVMARCRARFDGEARAPGLPATFSVYDVACQVAAELFQTFGDRLKDIGRRHWAQMADLPDGGHPGCSLVGGYVAGFPGDGGPPEVWFFLVTPANVAPLECKARGAPGRWAAVISPGADAAGAALRQIMREVPQTIGQAAAMARALIQAEIDRGSQEHAAAEGPIHLLALTPGARAREIGTLPCGADQCFPKGMVTCK